MGFSRSEITNMTSARAPGAPSTQGGSCRRHLLELFYKSNKFRCKLFTGEFFRLVIKKMISARALGAPSAQGARIDVIFRSFFINQISFDKNSLLGNFLGW